MLGSDLYLSNFEVANGNKKNIKRNEIKQVAQGQYVVSDTRCPALHDCEMEREEAGQRPQRGQSPVEHRGTFVCPEMANGL